MKSIVRITTAVNKVVIGNSQLCCDNIISIINSVKSYNTDILVFPKLALVSPSSSAFFSPAFAEQAAQQLDRIVASCHDFQGYVIVGTILSVSGKVIPVHAVIADGKLIGTVAANNDPCIFPGILPKETIFRIGNLTFGIVTCTIPEAFGEVKSAVERGCDLVIIPDYVPITVGITKEVHQLLKLASQLYGCGIAIINGGIGDSSKPFIYRGFAAVYECGKPLTSCMGVQSEVFTSCDIDSDIIQWKKPMPKSYQLYHTVQQTTQKSNLLRKINPNPYLPMHKNERIEYLEELFQLQIKSLYDRLSNTGIQKVVVGVSGGLDSTLALLVASQAIKLLNLPSDHLIGVTMPGFGTTDRTYGNAVKLIQLLGADFREISIRESVLQHFKDIGHDPSIKNVTYENAQARERTQILFDIANTMGALVVGTCDMSEGIMGWSTFGGDQMSNYNINVCLTKNMVREVVSLLREQRNFAMVKPILTDILATPVSPELLPPDKNGDISQKSEEILGSYDIHDFLFYYFAYCGFSREKLALYAMQAFAPRFTDKQLTELIQTFMKRYFAGQFKLSCTPDSAILTKINLTTATHAIPSDIKPF